MNLVYERTFLKDVKAIGDATIRRKIETIISSFRNAQNIGELKSVKKLKGHMNAYRIRIGDYRLGFIAEGETITIVRVMHRANIYKYFP